LKYLNIQRRRRDLKKSLIEVLIITGILIAFLLGARLVFGQKCEPTWWDKNGNCNPDSSSTQQQMLNPPNLEVPETTGNITNSSIGSIYVFYPGAWSAYVSISGGTYDKDKNLINSGGASYEGELGKYFFMNCDGLNTYSIVAQKKEELGQLTVTVYGHNLTELDSGQTDASYGIVQLSGIC
jgi:hypothetical protein